MKLKVQLPIHSMFKVFLKFSPRNIVANTTRIELSQTHTMSYVGTVADVSKNEIIIAPLVMGAPWLHSGLDAEPGFSLIWYNYAFYENFIDDIDEFCAVRTMPRDASSSRWKVLKTIPENKIKAAICRILKDPPTNDWAGERSDHFTSSVHLSGRRVSAAFLLKGPAKFTEMKANHLGKNGDQIYRLAQEPADLLILQHCHLVSPPVRAMLRAFAVSPAHPRRYIIMDGPDTYRLLVAYNCLDGS